MGTVSNCDSCSQSALTGAGDCRDYLAILCSKELDRRGATAELKW